MAKILLLAEQSPFAVRFCEGSSKLRSLFGIAEVGRAGNSHSSHFRPLTRNTRIALFLMGELVAALRANDPDAFRGLLTEGIQELGLTEVEELLETI